MSQRCRRSAACSLLIAATAAAGPRLVFMTPVGEVAEGQLPTYRRVTDDTMVGGYEAWLQNESAQFALGLYERAYDVMRRRGSAGDETPTYHVALVPGGNHADSGFRLEDGDTIREYAKRAYIKLNPDQRAFGNTFLHETGHVLLSILSGGEGIPVVGIPSIPHTTAALTERGTAFNEGFAIHLETIVAHISDDADMRARYRHERMDFGNLDIRESEYYRHAADLMSYSQSVARYYEVRENNYAFAPACREPDYLRVQLEKSRDFSTLLDANQLLQSEGFYASFFFSMAARGNGIPDRSTLNERYERTFAAIADMFATHDVAPDAPYLPWFVESYIKLHPKHAGEMTDLLLDLTHGVFVDAEAATLWSKLYKAARSLDLKNLPRDEIKSAYRRWGDAVRKDLSVLYSRLGPQLPCEVPSLEVTLVALGGSAPVAFDLNTVQEGIIRMIPGIDSEAVGHWLAERAKAPFKSIEDFKTRMRLSAETVAKLTFPNLKS